MLYCVPVNLVKHHDEMSKYFMSVNTTLFPPTWQNTLRYEHDIFGNSMDDGLAFLRSPGAFLSPNHFSHDENYDMFALFSGANVIFTTEMIEELLACDSSH